MRRMLGRWSGITDVVPRDSRFGAWCIQAGDKPRATAAQVLKSSVPSTHSDTRLLAGAAAFGAERQLLCSLGWCGRDLGLHGRQRGPGVLRPVGAQRQVGRDLAFRG